MAAKNNAKTRDADSGARVRAPRRSARGQAMVEYTLVTHLLLIGGAIGMVPVMEKLFEALSAFYAAIFFVLNSGAI